MVVNTHSLRARLLVNQLRMLAPGSCGCCHNANVAYWRTLPSRHDGQSITYMETARVQPGLYGLPDASQVVRA